MWKAQEPHGLIKTEMNEVVFFGCELNQQPQTDHKQDNLFPKTYSCFVSSLSKFKTMRHQLNKITKSFSKPYASHVKDDKDLQWKERKEERN